MPGHFSVDKLTSALVRTGPGPLNTIPRATVTATLDAAGSIDLTMPASDPRAVLLVPNVLNYAQVVVDGDRSDYSRIGILYERTTNPHTLELQLRGPNLLEELSFTNVGLLALESAPGSGLPMAAAGLLPAILAGTGWTSTGTPSRAVYHKFGREKTLAALIKLAELTGDHFRISRAVARRIEWLITTTNGFVPVPSGLTAKEVEDDDPDACLIVKDSLQIVRDGTTRCTRLYPYGGGNADAQLTINASTLGTANPGNVSGDYVYGDYTLHIDMARPDWSYIAHTVLDAAGSIGDVVTIGDATTISDTATDDESAANELVERAIVILRRRLVDQVSFRLRLLHADLSRLIEGASLRLRARCFVDAYEVMDLDEDVLIQEVPVTYGAGDPEAAITVTNLAVDRPASGGRAPVQLTAGAMQALYEAVTTVQELAGHKQPAVYALTAGNSLDTDGVYVLAGKLLSVLNNLTLSGTDGEGLTLTGSLAVGADTTVSGGGTLALGGFTATVPATGTVAMVGTSSVVLDEDVTALTISNDNTEQSLYSFSVPGGTLGTKNKLRLVMIGAFLNNTGGNAVPTIKVKYGATTILSDVPAALATSGSAHGWRVESELVAANATGAQVAIGTTYIGSTAGLSGVSNGTTLVRTAVHATVAEDSTAAKTLEITVTLPSAAVTLTFTCYAVFLELLRR